MKLVFQETTRKPLSFGLLLEFYRTANEMCKKSFGVTVAEGLSEIRLLYQKGDQYTQHIVFVVTLTESPETDIESAKQKWQAIGETYNWKFLGRLKEDANISDKIVSEFFYKEDWYEQYD